MTKIEAVKDKVLVGEEQTFHVKHSSPNGWYWQPIIEWDRSEQEDKRIKGRRRQIDGPTDTFTLEVPWEADHHQVKIRISDDLQEGVYRHESNTAEFGAVTDMNLTPPAGPNDKDMQKRIDDTGQTEQDDTDTENSSKSGEKKKKALAGLTALLGLAGAVYKWR